MTSVSSGWDFAPLLPGEYLVEVEPGAHGSEAIEWVRVTVNPGEVATIQLDSGIELVGPSPFATAPDRWQVHEAETDETLTSVSAPGAGLPVAPAAANSKLARQTQRMTAVLIATKPLDQ